GRGNCAGGERFRLLGALPLDLRHHPRVLLVPVGCAAARGRAAGGVPRAMALVVAAFERPRTLPARAVVTPGAGLQAVRLLGGGQAHQRRCQLAAPDGARVPLPDPVPAALDRVVLPPPSARLPEGVGAHDVRGRGAGPVPDPGAAPSALRRGVRDDRAPGTDCGDRELRLLQPALDRALRPALRRRRMALAVAAGGRSAADARGGRDRALARVASPAGAHGAAHREPLRDGADAGALARLAGAAPG